MERRLRLLFATPYLPRRGVSAAREHWWSLLGRLARRHDITLLAVADADEMGAEELAPLGLESVRLLPRRPWRPDDPLALLPRTVAGGYTDPAIAAAIAAATAARAYDIVQYEFIEMAGLLPRPRCPTILTVHQVPFAGEGPLWRAEGRPVRRGAVLLHRYLRELDFDLRAVLRAHHVITMSAEDAARLRRFHPGVRISVSPLAIDTDFFAPRAPGPTHSDGVDRVEVADSADVVFVGNFEHPPNVDAVTFLVREVVPQVGRPVRVRIIGHAIPPALAAFAREGIEVLGPVPDMRPHLAAARVVVAPVRFGTGMRGKVLEALAMARPVVTTPIGAEGLGATSGAHLLVASGSVDFASAIRSVLDDPQRGARLGREGRALVMARFDGDAVASAHEQIYEEVLREPGPTPTWAPDRVATWGGNVARFGRWPAIALGFSVLVWRGLRWHLRKWRRQGSTTSSASVHGTAAASREISAGMSPP